MVLNTIYKSVLLSVCISQPHFWWKDEGLGEHFREGSCRSSGFSSQKKHAYANTKARLEFGLLISNWWSCSNVVIHSQHFLQGSLLGINQLGRSEERATRRFWACFVFEGRGRVMQCIIKHQSSCMIHMSLFYNILKNNPRFVTPS